MTRHDPIHLDFNATTPIDNVALVVALGAACEIDGRRLAEDEPRLRTPRDRLWDRVQKQRLPNILNGGFPGARGGAILAASPEVAASTGSACHEGAEQPSAVLTAMGLTADRALGVIRLSLGRTTSAADVDRTADVLIRAWRRTIASTVR